MIASSCILTVEAYIQFGVFVDDDEEERGRRRMRMARITGPDLSPHSPQTSADDPAYIHNYDDSIRYASPPSGVG